MGIGGMGRSGALGTAGGLLTGRSGNGGGLGFGLGLTTFASALGDFTSASPATTELSAGDDIEWSDAAVTVARVGIGGSGLSTRAYRNDMHLEIKCKREKERERQTSA